MSEERLSIADYPLAERRRDIVRGKRGKDLDEITLEALLEDRVTIEDLRNDQLDGALPSPGQAERKSAPFDPHAVFGI